MDEGGVEGWNAFLQVKEPNFDYYRSSWIFGT